jgi:hypothetical protein
MSKTPSQNQIIRLRKPVDFEIDGRHGRVTLQFKPFDLFVCFMEDNENPERIEVYPKNLMDLGIQIRLSIHKNDFGISTQIDEGPESPQPSTFEVMLKPGYPELGYPENQQTHRKPQSYFDHFMEALKQFDPQALTSSSGGTYSNSLMVMTTMNKSDLQNLTSVQFVWDWVL